MYELGIMIQFIFYSISIEVSILVRFGIKMIENELCQQFYQLQPTPQVLYKSFSKSQLIFSSFILLLPNELQTL